MLFSLFVFEISMPRKTTFTRQRQSILLQHHFSASQKENVPPVDGSSSVDLSAHPSLASNDVTPCSFLTRKRQSATRSRSPKSAKTSPLDSSSRMFPSLSKRGDYCFIFSYLRSTASRLSIIVFNDFLTHWGWGWVNWITTTTRFDLISKISSGGLILHRRNSIRTGISEETCSTLNSRSSR